MGNIVQQVVEKIILVDAIGNRKSIPLEWCPTYSVCVVTSLPSTFRLMATQMLTGMIRLYYEKQRLPGSSLVKRGLYQLVSGVQRSKVGSSSWTLALNPGLTVEMSMIRHDCQNSTSCPRCGHLSTGWSKNEWANWYFLIILIISVFSRTLQSILRGKLSDYRGVIR